MNLLHYLEFRSENSDATYLSSVTSRKL